jgi:hypothetical protein
MTLPALDVAAIRHFCEQRVPPDALHEVRVEADVSPTAVTVVEVRAPWREDCGPEWTRDGVARLRYVAKHEHWVLYWLDRNQKWRTYDLLGPSPDVVVLLDEIDRDPTGIFWG